VKQRVIGSLAFNPGRIDVPTAFVLAAPGNKEKAAERPVAGDTGSNLDRILNHLHQYDPMAFPSIERYDYRIANSVETVMSGDDSMPDLVDVLRPENLLRLSMQLSGYRTIVALSEPAIEAVRAVGLAPRFVHQTHPGMRGLNNRFSGLGVDREGREQRVRDRCHRYAEEIIASDTCPPSADRTGGGGLSADRP
jgi:hypothetical protein